MSDSRECQIPGNGLYQTLESVMITDSQAKFPRTKQALKDDFKTDSSESPQTSSSPLSEPVAAVGVPNQYASSSSSRSSADGSTLSFNSCEDPIITKKAGWDKLRAKRPSFAHRLQDHVKMGSNLSETVKGKLNLGAKIIQKGGRQNVFKETFGINKGEELLKASQCYLYTTSGPIAGLIFISTDKIAFRSERSVTFSSDSGEHIKAPYKVVIPTEKIQRANRSENIDKPAEEYIEIMTDDGFDFWFMGFLRYDKAFNSIQKVISKNI